MKRTIQQEKKKKKIENKSTFCRKTSKAVKKLKYQQNDGSGVKITET